MRYFVREINGCADCGTDCGSCCDCVGCPFDGDHGYRDFQFYGNNAKWTDFLNREYAGKEITAQHGYNSVRAVVKM